MELSRRQQKIYDHIKRHPAKTFTPEDIANLIWGEENVWPTFWRHQTTSIMRWIVARTSDMDPRIERSTKLGRGSCAEYKIVRGEAK